MGSSCLPLLHYLHVATLDHPDRGSNPDSFGRGWDSRSLVIKSKGNMKKYLVLFALLAALVVGSSSATAAVPSQPEYDGTLNSYCGDGAALPKFGWFVYAGNYGQWECRLTNFYIYGLYATYGSCDGCSNYAFWAYHVGGYGWSGGPYWAWVPAGTPPFGWGCPQYYC